MPPLTLATLATLLQMHGAGTTIESDNKGVDHLLGEVREALERDADPNGVVLAGYQKFYDRGDYAKFTYNRADFSKSTANPPQYSKMHLVPPYGKGF